MNVFHRATLPRVIFALVFAGCGRELGESCERHEQCGDERALCLRNRCTDGTAAAHAALAALLAAGHADLRTGPIPADDNAVLAEVSRRCNLEIGWQTAVKDRTLSPGDERYVCVLRGVRELLGDARAAAVEAEVERDRTLLGLLGADRRRDEPIPAADDESAARMIDDGPAVACAAPDDGPPALAADVSLRAARAARAGRAGLRARGRRAPCSRGDGVGAASLLDEAALCADPAVITAVLDAVGDKEALERWIWEADIGTWESPLEVAARRGNVAVIEALARFGFPVDDTTGTALRVAVEADQGDAIDALVRLGARVDLPFHRDAFELAAGREIRDTTVRELRPERPAAFAALLRHTSRALIPAIAAGDLDAVRRIVAADPERARYDWTRGVPLVAAVAVGSEPMVRLLLEAGADATKANGDGWTALHEVAVGDGDVELARLLIEHGADPDARDGRGETPVDVATRVHLRTGELASFMRTRSRDPRWR
ncbi:MAG: ankyrin repeat domain-containing protein [Deltaproteobacteria bacterium]|nr:ankyrin repeat domain-containing protein [Deltaproteobacteria bacterium]